MVFLFWVSTVSMYCSVLVRCNEICIALGGSLRIPPSMVWGEFISGTESAIHSGTPPQMPSNDHALQAVSVLLSRGRGILTKTQERRWIPRAPPDWMVFGNQYKGWWLNPDSKLTTGGVRGVLTYAHRHLWRRVCWESKTSGPILMAYELLG